MNEFGNCNFKWQYEILNNHNKKLVLGGTSYGMVENKNLACLPALIYQMLIFKKVYIKYH